MQVFDHFIIMQFYSENTLNREQARSCRGHGGNAPQMKNRHEFASPPTGLLTTEFSLGTCFLYAILAPQGEGKGRYCPLRSMCPTTCMTERKIILFKLSYNVTTRKLSYEMKLYLRCLNANTRCCCLKYVLISSCIS